MEIGKFTCLQLLTHLHETYVKITQAEMDKNDQIMSKAWNPSTPIKDLFEKLYVGHKITMEGGDAPLATQLFCIGYNIIHKTGLFNATCRECHNKPMADNTIENIKSRFMK